MFATAVTGLAVWSSIVASVLISVTTGYTVARWLWQRWMRDLVQTISGRVLDELKSVLEQVTPNGGGTEALADRVVRVEGMVTELHRALVKSQPNP